MDNIYGLNFGIKSFAISNPFVVETNKACYQLGKQLKPFCFYANESQRKYGVLDFSKFESLTGKGLTLIDEILMYRKQVFEDFGIRVNVYDDLKKKLLLYDYLMSISICYVEIPKYITKGGVPTPTYDKFLCTKNPAIMSAWMGVDIAEMQAKYSSRIASRQIEFDDNEIRFVKLNHTNKGNSITLPRNSYSVKEMTCIPLYMLYAFIEGFKPLIEGGIVNFSFLKDNGTIRELATTLNKDILMNYYNDTMFVGTMLSGVDINSVEQGGLLLSSKINRGYIKVPELGSSIYDGTGVRSLNVARLLKAEVVNEVDRSFINVDLNSVLENFGNSLDYLLKTSPNELGNVYLAIVGEKSDTNQPAVIVSKLREYAESRGMLLSTTFYRTLHLFMVGNPQWFPLYTGKPAQKVTSSANFGVAPMDF